MLFFRHRDDRFRQLVMSMGLAGRLAALPVERRFISDDRETSSSTIPASDAACLLVSAGYSANNVGPSHTAKSPPLSTSWN
jgi:hypothetical protein